jgi:hypothetical protein
MTRSGLVCSESGCREGAAVLANISAQAQELGGRTPKSAGAADDDKTLVTITDDADRTLRVDDIEISERDVQEMIAKIIGEQMMALTGRVPDR